MDTVETKQCYFKLTKRFLMISGIWPDQNEFSKYMARFIIYTLGVSSVLTQIAKLVCFFNLDALAEQLAFISAGILLLTKQGTYIVKETELKELLNGMFNDWISDRPEEEMAIMKSYVQKGNFFRSIYMANTITCVLLFVQMPFWPRIADILMPLNTSRPRIYIYPAYYFIDENKYYYFMIAHMSSTVIVMMFVCNGCDTCYIYAVQHACGLLAVAGCLKEIEDLHFGYLFICMGCVTAAFSGTLVMVSRVDVDSRFYQYCIFLMIQLMHLFFLMLQGQFVIDSNDEIYDKIYDGTWYNAVPKTQALYILALRRTKTSPQITAGGLITLNLQSFSTIIRTCFSYFTVLRST